MYQGFKDLKVYTLAYELANDVFHIPNNFPKEERYSLTDQIRRSSRSICSNIAEGYRKRRYPKHFVSKLTEPDAKCSETLVWIYFAFDCEYINNEQRNFLTRNRKK